MKLCSDTAARILWRPRGGQGLLEPRDERRERGELHVRGVVDRRERASERVSHPAVVRHVPTRPASVGGAQAFGQRLEERPPPVAAEESHGHSRPRVLLLPCPAGWMQQKGDSERFINVSVTETICACALVPVQHHWNRYA
jgi:hypothetical protein